MTEQSTILDTVYQVILERKSSQGANSYTASLMGKGLDAVLKKVGEEATELVIAGKGGQADEVVYEMADLFFHALVLLGYQNIPLERVFGELHRRFGISGIDEKNSRPT
jgi:phosphoribosyl-ATP pyrophosphohydrolase